MCIIDCLSTMVFILPLHLDYTKVIILILWWRNFQLEYWRTFQLVSTGGQLNSMLLAIFGLAKHLDIDLIWHINQKMRYNELRENKHGKKY